MAEGGEQDAPAAEQKYFDDTYEAFRDYMTYHLAVNHIRRMGFLTLPKEHKRMLERVGYKDKLDAVDEAIRRNAEFLEEIAGRSSLPFMPEPVIGEEESGQPDLPSNGSFGQCQDGNQAHTRARAHDGAGHQASRSTVAKRQAARDQSQEKVRSTLRQMVRDWSVEGQQERLACYLPCVQALDRHYATVDREQRSRLKILVPGAGLGRLPLEIASRGFACQGNEFSSHMLIASNWCLNESSAESPFQIHPYVHSLSNHSSTADSLLQAITIPDVSPSALLAPGSDFSYVAGDFLEVYGGRANVSGARVAVPDEHRGKWAAVVTCFFVDTARNVVNYVQTIRDLLAEDGVWINLGPLLWHFENVIDREKAEPSVELSLDELLELTQDMGFEVSDVQMIQTTYSAPRDSMLKSEYNAAFFTAKKGRQ